MDGEGPLIKVVEDGPYRVSGTPLVRMRALYSDEGDGVEWVRGAPIGHPDPVELCRCGRSKTKPFCDGTERTAAFDGTETADRRPTAERRRDCEADSPLQLTDDRSLCAHMAFCGQGKVNAWSLARESEDPDNRERVIWMVRRCPSGRLQYRIVPDPEPVEEDLPSEVAVVADGPLWVRGGVPVEAADGFRYEVRNRVALCRCGHSQNKPFCDGSHWNVGFKDP
jgi:CDGSH-type Zn-finger protein